MKNILVFLALLFVMNHLVYAENFYVGEKVVIAPLELTITNLKYSQGKGFDKPGMGNLFLMGEVCLSNNGSIDIALRVRDLISIIVLNDTILLDTIRIFPAEKIRVLAAHTEKTFPVKFVVSRTAPEQGVLLLFQYGKVRAHINLKYNNATDGHLAAGISFATDEKYGNALREFRAALALSQFKNNDKRCYVLYRIGEVYTRMFLYKDAIVFFEDIVKNCKGDDLATEATGHITALQKRIATETPQAKVARLVECGYAYAFLLGESAQALTLFKKIRSEYASYPIGVFSAGQVASLYAINVHMNLKQYEKAMSLYTQEKKGASGEYALQLQKMKKQIARLQIKGN